MKPNAYVVASFQPNVMPGTFGKTLTPAQLNGLIAYLLEENEFPIAPAILGVVLGGMLEENFITSMIKSDGSLAAFFSRPIAAALAVTTMLVWFAPPVMKLMRRRAG